MADLTYSLVLRAANLQKANPKTSRRLWKLYDRLIVFLEAIPTKKSK